MTSSQAQQGSRAPAETTAQQNAAIPPEPSFVFDAAMDTLVPVKRAVAPQQQG
jgi:hypothetical protein